MLNPDRANALRRFEDACLGLVANVRRACEPGGDLYVPYYGVPSRVAVWYARNCVREARRLGLYPQTAQLEAEARQAA